MERRWGISRNGLKARARALGVELIRVSPTLTTWPGAFIELGERLHEHLQSGQPMGTFPGLKPVTGDGSPTAVTPAEQTAIVKAHGSDLAALVADNREVASAPATDPLLRARGLSEAADNALVLTTTDLAALLGQGGDVMAQRASGLRLSLRAAPPGPTAAVDGRPRHHSELPSRSAFSVWSQSNHQQ